MLTLGIALFCYFTWKLSRKNVSLQRSIKQIRNDNERRKLYKI